MIHPQITRRSFARACAATALAGVAVPFGCLSHAPDPSPAPIKGKFIDFHTHLGQVWNTKEELTADALLNWMDAHEIMQAVVLPLVSPESSSYVLTTDFILEKTRPHRDRLIPFCCIDPRTSFSGGSKGMTDMLQKYIDQGAKGFGEHKTGVPIDDPRSMMIYAACGRLGLPVLFHLDNIRNTDEPGLPGLEKVLQDRPGTTFIGHGPGWWASISGGISKLDLGGYPEGPIAPGGAIDRLMDKYANLHCDLSAGSGAGAMQRDMKFAREFLIRRADRIVFGTDYLAPGQPVAQFEILAKLDLPEDVSAKIYRDNARRMLKM